MEPNLEPWAKIRQLLGLSITDLKVYTVLLQEYGGDDLGLSVTEITEKLGKSRSTVERSLLKLMELGLVERRRVLSRSGSYTCVYKPKPLEEVKKILLEKLDEEYRKARQLLEHLDKDQLSRLV